MLFNYRSIDMHTHTKQQNCIQQLTSIMEELDNITDLVHQSNPIYINGTICYDKGLEGQVCTTTICAPQVLSSDNIILQQQQENATLTGNPTQFQTACQAPECLGVTFDCSCFHTLIYSVLSPVPCSPCANSCRHQHGHCHPACPLVTAEL